MKKESIRLQKEPIFFPSDLHNSNVQKDIKKHINILLAIYMDKRTTDFRHWCSKQLQSVLLSDDATDFHFSKMEGGPNFTIYHQLFLH